jgi:pathogenesis-related protein 1
MIQKIIVTSKKNKPDYNTTTCFKNNSIKKSLKLLGLIIFLFSCHAYSQITYTGSDVSVVDANKMLEHHNKVRKDVGVSGLQWDAKLSAYAQRWADYLATNNHCKMKHRGSKEKEGAQYGENIFWGSSAKSYSPLDASTSWYSEISKYTYAQLNSDNWYPAGHYTQMVWRNTTLMGAGVAICPDGEIIVVANYNPPGNYMGEYPY